MNSNLARLRDHLTRGGATARVEGDRLVVSAEGGDEGQSVTFTLSVASAGPDVHRAGLVTSVVLPFAGSAERTAFLSMLAVFTNDFDVARVSLVVPGFDDEDADAQEDGDTDAQEDDAEDDTEATHDSDEAPVQVLISATCYLSGLEDAHAPALLSTVRGFVGDAVVVRELVDSLAMTVALMDDRQAQGEGDG